MEIIDYLEVRVAEQVGILRTSYDDLHERAYKLATLLLAGGGAAGAFALAELSKAPGNLFNWAPLAGLALSWFGTAAVLMWYGATAREIPSGANVQSLRDRYQYELSMGNADEAKALLAARQAVLLKAQERVGAFTQGCNDRADAIDLAYKAAVICSPLVPAVIAVACYLATR